MKRDYPIVEIDGEDSAFTELIWDCRFEHSRTGAKTEKLFNLLRSVKSYGISKGEKISMYYYILYKGEEYFVNDFEKSIQKIEPHHYAGQVDKFLEAYGR